jgi:hypothetical protein
MLTLSFVKTDLSSRSGGWISLRPWSSAGGVSPAGPTSGNPDIPAHHAGHREERLLPRLGRSSPIEVRARASRDRKTFDRLSFRFPLRRRARTAA